MFEAKNLNLPSISKIKLFCEFLETWKNPFIFKNHLRRTWNFPFSSNLGHGLETVLSSLDHFKLREGNLNLTNILFWWFHPLRASHRTLILGFFVDLRFEVYSGFKHFLEHLSSQTLHYKNNKEFWNISFFFKFDDFFPLKKVIEHFYPNLLKPLSGSNEISLKIVTFGSAVPTFLSIRVG